MKAQETNTQQLTHILTDLVNEVKVLREKVDALTTPGRSETSGKRRLMNTGQVSVMLDKTPLTIYRMVKRGELVAYKKGRELFFFEDEVMESLRSAKMNASS